jgi:hypothetical protein
VADEADIGRLTGWMAPNHALPPAWFTIAPQNQGRGYGTGFPTKRVTTQSFPGALTIPQFDPTIAFGYMGDYTANVSDGSHQYFVWGDNRDTVTDFLYRNGGATPTCSPPSNNRRRPTGGPLLCQRAAAPVTTPA